MTRNRGGFGRNTFEQLALYKSKPINRDTLGVVQFTAPTDDEPAQPKLFRPTRAGNTVPDPCSLPRKRQLFTAADEAKRRLSAAVGGEKGRVPAPPTMKKAKKNKKSKRLRWLLLGK